MSDTKEPIHERWYICAECGCIDVEVEQIVEPFDGNLEEHLTCPECGQFWWRTLARKGD